MITSQTSPSAVYSDLNALQGIRTLGKQDKNAALMEVAKQFESMFVNMMMSSMREANAVFSEDSLLNSPETEFYQQMYDDQMALTLSSGKGVGLAPVIYRQLSQQYGDTAAKELDQSRLSERRIHTPRQATQLKATMAEVEKERHNKSPNSSAVAVTNTNDIASGQGGKGQQFASPSEFVAALYPVAEKIGQELDVEPKAIVAQAALETGWGRYMISDEQGRNSYNFFGIKADSRWQGEKVEVMTHEFRGGVPLKERAAFRSYASLEDGLRDYADFLKQGARYQDAIGNGLTSEHYGHALQRAGYATDPSYGDKIQRISRSDTLNQAVQLLQGVSKDG